MKSKTKKVLYLIIIIFLIFFVAIFFFEKTIKPEGVTRDIEESNFIILQTITDPFTGKIVYVAADNSCLGYNLANKDDGCSVSCGDSTINACYFFEYESFTQKPRVLGAYWGSAGWPILPLLKFKDKNTILITTREDLGPGGLGSDTHYKIYKGEFDTRTGTTIIATSTEYYIPYESMP